MGRHTRPREETKRVKKRVNHATKLKNNKTLRKRQAREGVKITPIKLPAEVVSIPEFKKPAVQGKVNARTNRIHRRTDNTNDTYS